MTSLHITLDLQSMTNKARISNRTILLIVIMLCNQNQDLFGQKICVICWHHMIDCKLLSASSCKICCLLL